jgi:hypothetical protein
MDEFEEEDPEDLDDEDNSQPNLPNPLQLAGQQIVADLGNSTDADGSDDAVDVCLTDDLIGDALLSKAREPLIETSDRSDPVPRTPTTKPNPEFATDDDDGPPTDYIEVESPSDTPEDHSEGDANDPPQSPISEQPKIDFEDTFDAFDDDSDIHHSDADHDDNNRPRPADRLPDEDLKVDETLQLGPLDSPFLTAHQTYPEDNDAPVHPPQTSPPVKRRPARSAPTPPGDLTNLRDRSLLKKPILGYTPADYREVLSNLMSDRTEQALAHNFDDGAMLNEAIRHLQEAQREQAKLDMQREHLEKCQKAKEELSAEVAAFDATTARMLGEIQREFDEKVALAFEKQEKEMQEHFEQWNSVRKLRQYNTASGNLIVQRRQLALLLKQCQFEEAAQVQKGVDKLTMIEQIEARKQMQKDYSDNVRRIAEKHDAEIDMLRSALMVRQTQLVHGRQNQKLIFLRRQRKIEKKTEEAGDKDKLWAQRARPPVSKPGHTPKSEDGTQTIKLGPAPTTIQLPPLTLERPMRRYSTTKPAN